MTGATDIRAEIRAGRIISHTSGLADGFVQGNLAIVPQAYAEDFARFCALNPQACPMLAIGQPGDPALPTLGAGIDVRSDLPRYRVFRDGRLVDEPTDITALWRPDLVAFVIGCSFTFERALVAGGIPLRHVQQGRNVAMYRTNRMTSSAGPFHGPLVVSMRPVAMGQVAKAVRITGQFPDQHGAPIHAGDPAALGIQDLATPDWGDAVTVLPGETPVFWACGVTSQAALETARIPFIAHAPGSMLITDWPAPTVLEIAA